LGAKNQYCLLLLECSFDILDGSDLQDSRLGFLAAEACRRDFLCLMDLSPVSPTVLMYRIPKKEFLYYVGLRTLVFSVHMYWFWVGQ